MKYITDLKEPYVYTKSQYFLFVINFIFKNKHFYPNDPKN